MKGQLVVVLGILGLVLIAVCVLTAFILWVARKIKMLRS